jgi:RHS repeat-associated protein
VVRVNSSNPMYVYDGAGLRVKKCDPHCTSPTTTTVYIFSGTQVIAEYVNGAAVNSPTREYVYSGGVLVATHEGSTLKFHHQDHLSRRVTSDGTSGSQTYGEKIADSGHFPYGESWYESGGTLKLKFTSYERDSESGNDYAIFRFYSSRNGRFCSADPLAGSIANPQSLNRYAYVQNDPINLVDPLGLEIECFQAFQVRVETDRKTGEVLSVSVTPLGTFCFTGLVFPDYAPLPPPENNGGDGSQDAQEPTDKKGRPCWQKILDRVNAKFGTNFTILDIVRDPTTKLLTTTMDPKTGKDTGTANITIGLSNATLTSKQFNSIETGRSGGGSVGANSTLHVPSADKRNLGSQGFSGTFRAHLDLGNPSKFPFLPGIVRHFLGDVATNSAGPCP